jgi:hypothetical protein
MPAAPPHRQVIDVDVTAATDLLATGDGFPLGDQVTVVDV